MLGRWCSWMRCGDEVYVVEGKRKVLLTMCRSVLWYDSVREERGRVLCLVRVCWRVSCCCSWIELHGFVFLLRVVRFDKILISCWECMLFSNVVSLTWLRNMMMGTKELEILTDTRFQRWNFCSNCLVFFHFECFFLRLLIFFFTKTSIRQ